MTKTENGKFFFRGKLFDCFSKVYIPYEDSYFLAENVSVKKNCLCVDVGSGSGIQSIGMLMRGCGKVIALDINSKAVKATRNNCALAGFSGKIDARKSNLFSNCPEKTDVIVFNPPYLESGKVEFVDLDGGAKGREVLDRFIEQFPKHLKKGGKCFFLQTDLNGYPQTERKLKAKKLSFKKIAVKRLFFEELCIYKCWKKR